ncbi:MAG: DPP IV N-terminal domain-containing protein [Gemmatimonadales bacterium]
MDLRAGTVTVAQAAKAGPAGRDGLAPSFALVGNHEISVATSNFSRTTIAPGRVRIRFNLAQTNKLQHSDLVTPTFPAPPAGVAGVLLFPFKTVALGANGQPLPLAELRAQPSVDWNGTGAPGSGAPHNFFNSAICLPLPGNDCFRWESFGTPLEAGTTSAARTVGFDADALVMGLEIFVLLAADIDEQPVTPAAPPIAFALFTSADGYEIYVINPDGSGQTRLTDNDVIDADPTWSPDRSKIAFVSDGDIYVMNPDGSGQTPLTNDAFDDMEPEWSRDGSKIAFVSFRGGNTDIWMINPDGTGPIELTTTSSSERDPSWSPDGSKLVFESLGDIWVMNASVGSMPTKLTTNPFSDAHPAWSPDGSRIVYTANSMADDGEGSADPFFELHLMNPDGSGKVKITTDNFMDLESSWSPDGSRLVYTSYRPGTPQLMTMNATGGGESPLTPPAQSSERADW